MQNKNFTKYCMILGYFRPLWPVINTTWIHLPLSGSCPASVSLTASQSQICQTESRHETLLYIMKTLNLINVIFMFLMANYAETRKITCFISFEQPSGFLHNTYLNRCKQLILNPKNIYK